MNNKVLLYLCIVCMLQCSSDHIYLNQRSWPKQILLHLDYFLLLAGFCIYFSFPAPASASLGVMTSPRDDIIFSVYYYYGSESMTPGQVDVKTESVHDDVTVNAHDGSIESGHSKDDVKTESVHDVITVSAYYGSERVQREDDVNTASPHGDITAKTESPHGDVAAKTEPTYNIVTVKTQSPQDDVTVKTESHKMTLPSKRSHHKMTLPSKRSHHKMTLPSKRSHHKMTSPSKRSHHKMRLPSKRSHHTITSPSLSKRSHHKMTSPSKRSHHNMTSPSARITAAARAVQDQTTKQRRSQHQTLPASTTRSS